MDKATKQFVNTSTTIKAHNLRSQNSLNKIKIKLRISVFVVTVSLFDDLLNAPTVTIQKDKNNDCKTENSMHINYFYLKVQRMALIPNSKKVSRNEKVLKSI